MIMAADNNNIPDFSENFKKIFQITDNIRRLRAAFPFSENDARARLDQQILKQFKRKQQPSNS